MSLEILAQRLRMLMRENGWGIKAFANRIPADKNSVKTWLACKYYPRYDSLVKIADLFGVSVDFLAGFSDERGEGYISAVSLFEIKECYIKRVSEALLSRKMTAENLAESIGVIPQTVENWFFEKKFPETALIVKTARVLNCSLDFLLGRERACKRSGR